MFHKFFIRLSLTSILLATTPFCFAMEPEEVTDTSPIKEHLNRIQEQEILVKDIEGPKQKANFYGKLVELLVVFSPVCSESLDNLHCSYLTAKYLAHQGTLTFNALELEREKLFLSRQHIEELDNPIQLLKRSNSIQKSITSVLSEDLHKYINVLFNFDELSNYTSKNLNIFLSTQNKLYADLIAQQGEFYKEYGEIREKMHLLIKSENCKEKVDSFESCVKKLESLKSLCSEPYAHLQVDYLLAQVLLLQGITMYDFSLENEKKLSSSQSINEINRTIERYKESFQLQTKTLAAQRGTITDTGREADVDEELLVYTSERLEDALYDRSGLYCLHAQKHIDKKLEDHITILDLYSKALEDHEEAYGITRNLNKQQKSFGKLHDILFSIITTIAVNILRENVDKLEGIQKAKALLIMAENSKKFATISEGSVKVYKDIFANSSQKNMEIFNNEEYEKYCPTIHSVAPMATMFFESSCTYFKKTAHAFNTLKTPNEEIKNLYEAKGKECYQIAFDTYNQEIYEKLKYGSESTKALIDARLESLNDNEKPLQEFYQKLRQERNAQRKKELKARQEETMGQKIRSHQEALKQQQEKAQQIEHEKERLGEEKVAKKALTPPTELSTDSSTSSTNTVTTNMEDYPKEPKPKVKTHGVSDASKDKKTPKKHAGEPKVVQSSQEQRLIVLTKEDYRVFLVLIGNDPDKNITLKSVTKFLSRGLECNIFRGAKHRIAKAANGAEWTLPPKWDGPISNRYLHQLMDFILGSLEIDPDFVKCEGE